MSGGTEKFLDKFADIKVGDTEEVIRTKIDNAQKRIKNLMRQGDTTEVDKIIEEKDELEEKNNKMEKEKIIAEKRNLRIEIETKKNLLRKVIESGGNVGLIKKELFDLEENSDKQDNKLAEIVVREKHRETLQKSVDKYTDKQRAKLGKPEEKKEKEAKSK